MSSVSISESCPQNGKGSGPGEGARPRPSGYPLWMTRISLDDLLPLEREGWDALCRSRGGRFYGGLMTQEAVMILVNGMVLDRAAIAASLDDAPPWSSYALEDARLVPTGADSAALVYRATASRSGDAEPFVALMSSHYRLLEGRLRMTLYQQTTSTR